MSGAGKVHIGPPSMLSILFFFLSACRMYSSCKSSCNSSCKDVVKTASLRLTLFAYVSIGIRFLWCILSHTVERGRQQNLWLRTSSNQFLSHSISSSFNCLYCLSFLVHAAWIPLVSPLVTPLVKTLLRRQACG